MIHIKDNNILQFLKFCIVGLSNTIVSYLINIIVVFFLSRVQVYWDYMAGNVAGFVCGTVWSFIWNDRFVFKERREDRENKGRILIKTFLIYGFTIILVSNCLSWVWINVFGISKFIAPIINLCISVPLNFLLNKFWAFKG